MEPYTQQFEAYETNWKLTIEKVDNNVNAFVEPVGDKSFSHISVSFAFLEFAREPEVNKVPFDSANPSPLMKEGENRVGGRAWDALNDGTKTFVLQNSAYFLVDLKANLQWYHYRCWNDSNEISIISIFLSNNNCNEINCCNTDLEMICHIWDRFYFKGWNIFKVFHLPNLP